MKLIEEFIAFDLETTGLDFDKDAIIEIAMVKFSQGKVVESYSQTINPHVEVREFILQLTGMNQEEINQAKAFSEHATEIQAFIGTLPLVAHNSKFDIHFLNKEFGKIDIAPITNPVIDSLLCSRIAWPESPNHKLETLVQFLELEETNAHRALPDAIHCGEVFIHAQKIYQTFDPELTEALSAMAEFTSLESLFDTPDARDKFDFQPYTFRNQEQVPLSQPSTSESPTYELKDLFGSQTEQGIFHEAIPGYQFRQSQYDYAESVLKGLNGDQFLSLEAGTGIGKTLAYLSALAIWTQSQTARVVISTGTKQQQNQIIQKALPVLNKYFDFKFSVIKGRDNYLCLRKYAFYLNQRNQTLSVDDREHFLTLIPWVSKTLTGDISENSGFNPMRNRILWQKLKGEGRSCQGPQCQDEYKCYAFEARKKATQSQVMLINHALFFKDLELDFSLLPSWDRIIFDEAHQLFKQGPQHLGSHFMFYTLRNHFQLIHNPYAENTGLIHALISDEDSLPQESALSQEILEDMQTLERKVHRFFGKLGKKISKLKLNTDRFRYQEGFATLFNLTPEPIYTAIAELIGKCQQLHELLSQEDHKAAEFAQGLISFRLALQDFQSQFRHIVAADQEDQVFWVQDWHNPHKLQLHSAPGDLSALLSEKLYPWLRSALFTSATLTPNGSFDFFKKQMGLKSTSRTKEFTFASPYLESQMKLQLMSGLSKGGSKEHSKETADWLKSYLPQHKESTLILYTSVAQLMNHQKALRDHLEGRNLLSQHIDGGIDNLLGLFKKQKGSILQGNQIFWEGLDCPGDELETIIIPKLPFPNPFEPRIAWLAEQIEAKGGNPFNELHIPLALLELKQGMGRLIRSEQDRGTIIILDNRVVRAGYAKQFHKLWNGQHEVIEG